MQYFGFLTSLKSALLCLLPIINRVWIIGNDLLDLLLDIGLM